MSASWSLGDGVEAISAAGKLRRGEFDGDVECAAEVRDFFGVGGDQDLVELRAGARGFDDPGEQGLAGDFAQDLAGQAGGGEAGWDDAEDAGGGRHRCWRLESGEGQLHSLCRFTYHS